MDFTGIGSWLDVSIDRAQQSWRGNEARKTIQDIIERSVNSLDGSRDQVTLSGSGKGEKTSFHGVLQNAVNSGNDGSSIRPKTDMKVIEQKLLGMKGPPPTITHNRVHQIDGWNVS